MFKLAWLDGWIDLKHNVQEHKSGLLITVLLLILVVLKWPDVFIGVAVGVFFNMRSDYGKNRILPELFQMLPMSGKEKKKYILYRMFGVDILPYMVIVIIIYAFLLLKGENPELEDWMFCALISFWWVLICVKSQFKQIYPRISGNRYYRNITETQKRAFWFFRIGDWVAFAVFLTALLFFANIKGTDAAYQLGLPVMLLFILLYLFASGVHFVRYIRKAMDCLEVV